MKEYIVKLPLISVEAHSEAEAYGLVMQWLKTTLSALPISETVLIEPAEVVEYSRQPDASNVIDFKKYRRK